MNKPLLVLLFLPLSFLANNACAQNDEAAILDTVDAFFAALENRDRVALETITVPGSFNVSVRLDEKEAASYGIRNHAELVTALSSPGDTKRIERYWDPIVLIQKTIAVFWAPYDFHIDGEFSHCGIDSFQLIKQEGNWLLTNTSWTMETDGCLPSPLGPIE